MKSHLLLKLGHFPPASCNAQLLEVMDAIKGGVGRTLWGAVAPVRAPILRLSLKQMWAAAGSPGNGQGESR